MARNVENLLATLARLPAGSKFSLLAGFALIIAVSSVAWMWGTTPEYRVLFSNVSDRDGGAIVAQLNQMNIPYKFAEGGGAILVPGAMVHDARLKLASQGLPRGSLVGFELMENQKFGLTQFQEQINYQRALEGELARSIQSLAAVQGARVHLAIPKPSVFMREQQKPTASVLVSLHQGRSLERAQVTGIVHLVSSSVPELTTRNISVLDQMGNLLSAQHSGLDLDPAQLAYMQQVESNVVKRIHDILEPIVGRSNVRAQVTAEIDFSQGETTSETFKPNQNGGDAAVRNQQTSDSGASSSPIAQGVPGASSNQPGGTGGSVSSIAGGGRRDSNTSYEVDRSVRHVRQPVGAIRRLSAAVVVNHRKSTDAEGKVTPAPLPEETMNQINALVKEAMGFTQARGDTINVANAVFSSEVTDPPPELPVWQRPENIAMAKELGKSLLLALLFLYLIFGVIRPMFRRIGEASALQEPLPGPDGAMALPVDAEAAPAPASLSVPGPDTRLESIRELARNDPKIVANVVKSWVTKE